ncbi:CDCA2 protein, partial [Formicarius rufipectus]|nr:CDCA2 protein [Formicarius rufipectus]
STIGLRGSPENNSLIRYLAQQRSTRQREALPEVCPYKHANVRPLKDRMEAFQTSFESLQEAEVKTELPELSHVGDASQEGDSCKKTQNKPSLKKEPHLEQGSEKFMLDNSGADVKAYCSESVTKSSESDPRTCSVSSPHRGVAEPAAPKEWVYEEKNPTESLETVVTGDILEAGHGKRTHH